MAQQTQPDQLTTLVTQPLVAALADIKAELTAIKVALTFDKDAPKGVWPSFAQMVYDGLVNRYANSLGQPDYAPLAYLLGAQLGGPAELPRLYDLLARQDNDGNLALIASRLFSDAYRLSVAELAGTTNDTIAQLFFKLGFQFGNPPPYDYDLPTAFVNLRLAIGALQGRLDDIAGVGTGTGKQLATEETLAALVECLCPTPTPDLGYPDPNICGAEFMASEVYGVAKTAWVNYGGSTAAWSGPLTTIAGGSILATSTFSPDDNLLRFTVSQDCQACISLAGTLTSVDEVRLLTGGYSTIITPSPTTPAIVDLSAVYGPGSTTPGETVVYGLYVGTPGTTAPDVALYLKLRLVPS